MVDSNHPHQPDNGGTERSRFVVGIDLGTTNCAVCYVDTHQDPWHIRTFAVAQLTAPGQMERMDTLPSFHYEPVAGELQVEALRLPWNEDEPDYVAGVFARDHGRHVPGRLIHSAKSWLCHSGVDRKAALLPWHGAADVESLSPVEVSARYLDHIRRAWDTEFSEYRLSDQDVVLTIPASFDEVARELTVAAARMADLPRIVLIEEPQAAFYSWVDAHRDNWDQQVSAGQKILVCDIGGGTSDFTLIHVRPAADGKLQFHRVAVGEHLILGGDNLDLALAHHAEGKLVDHGRLEPRHWDVLVPACRHAKELLLGEQAPEQFTLSVSTGGARLIGDSLQLQLTRDVVVQMLLDGFLPQVGLDEKPARRQSGFQEFGLPYAPDAAITRYLAAFLTAHTNEAADAAPGASARPDVVLFNGGFFASPMLRGRLIDVMRSWFTTEDPNWVPRELNNERLDLSVARGAAYFGMVRRGTGVRIAAGLARTYYVGVADESGEPAALCLVSAGTEPAAETLTIDREFDLRTDKPVEFPIFVSSTRLTDQPGHVVPIDNEQMTSLPPIRTVLQTRKTSVQASIRARLGARLTEIGTLEVWCSQSDGPRRWQLQFDVRSATQTDLETHSGHAEQAGIVDERLTAAVSQIIASVFGTGATHKPAGLPRRIAQEIELSRDDWPPSLLRSMWSRLMKFDAARQLSADHEARWLNLLGYALRPGFGMAVDDWRVEETWRALHGRLVHGSPACRVESRVLWRRIAGGLAAGRQKELTSSVLASIRQRHRQSTTGRGKGSDYASGTHEAAEVWRMLGSMELLGRRTRIEVGEMILDLLPKKKFVPIRPALIWTIGRIGARVTVYGPLDVVLPPDVIVEWTQRMFAVIDEAEPVTQLALMQLVRRTDDRYRDVPDSVRDDVAERMESANARPHFIELIRTGGTLDHTESRLIFGESLPIGLRLR